MAITGCARKRKVYAYLFQNISTDPVTPMVTVYPHGLVRVDKNGKGLMSLYELDLVRNADPILVYFANPIAPEAFYPVETIDKRGLSLSVEISDGNPTVFTFRDPYRYVITKNTHQPIIIRFDNGIYDEKNATMTSTVTLETDPVVIYTNRKPSAREIHMLAPEGIGGTAVIDGESIEIQIY